MTTLREKILNCFVKTDFFFSALEFCKCDLEFLIKIHLFTRNSGTVQMLLSSTLRQKPKATELHFLISTSFLERMSEVQLSALKDCFGDNFYPQGQLYTTGQESCLLTMPTQHFKVMLLSYSPLDIINKLLVPSQVPKLRVVQVSTVKPKAKPAFSIGFSIIRTS